MCYTVRWFKTRKTIFFFLMIRHPPKFPLFPYTTLFRSAGSSSGRDAAFVGRPAVAGAGPGRRALPGGGRRARCRLGVGEIGRAPRLNSSHANISYAVFCLKKKKEKYDLGSI